jgi:hypothetical protein
LLVQAIRSGNVNWLPVLSFVCAHWFALDNRLRSVAFQNMLQTVPPRGELLPAPRFAGVDREYIGHAGQGLRIRSTIALAYCLGDPPAHVSAH